MARNIPLFVAFRVLFNARFYYPVLGVLFLDLGLTLEQYALLNVVWAVAIIVLEVPSGALADAIGRKNMVVFAAALMVAEMAVFAFAPMGTNALFWWLVLNRILSGAAEACASGADEALAYDSLPPGNRDQAWPKVLATLMRWQSGSFFVAMIGGAALFDPSVVRTVTGFFGMASPLTTTRFPVYATMGTALLCLAVAVAMREPDTSAKKSHAGPREALRNISRGAAHVFRTPRILSLVLAALVCDSFVRLFLTFSSNYNRLIELPEVAYGVVGSLMGLLGFAAAPLARRMVEKHPIQKNFGLLAGLIILGLTGAAFAWPVWGVWVLVPLGLSMSMLSFFTSHYLNAWTASEFRATVLSFRGVAMNLGYGAIGLAFAGLNSSLRTGLPDATDNKIFAHAIVWLPSGFLVAILTAAGIALWLAQAQSHRPTKH
jgi:MFS family permease